MIPVMERDATLYEVLFYCLLFHYRGSYTRVYMSVYACARSMNQKSGIIASSETGKFIDRLRKIYRNCSFYNFRKRKCGEEKEFSRYRSNYELNVIKITRVIAG